MSNGAFGENFPYSNFHDLNMDWIIKIAKDFLDQYTHIQETITEGLESLETTANTLNQLLQDWYDTHSQDIANQLADALSDLNEWYETHQNYLDATLAENLAEFNRRADAKAEQTIASIPEDYTQVANDALEVKNAVKAKGLEIEQGQLTATDGSEQDSDIRIRTGYMAFSELPVDIYASSGYELRVFQYNHDYSFYQAFPFGTHQYINNNNYLIRLVVRKTAGTNITPDDFETAITGLDDAYCLIPSFELKEENEALESEIDALKHPDQSNLNYVLTDKKDMIWSWWYYPQAVSFKRIRNQLYWGYTSHDGYTGIAQYDYDTGNIIKNNLKKSDADDHNGIALYVFPNGRIICAYAGGHNVDRKIHIRISTTPESVERFRDVIDLEASGLTSYGQFIYYNDNLYLFYRVNNNHWVYRYSTDQGFTWSEETRIIITDIQYYCKFTPTSEGGRIRITMYSNPGAEDSNIRMGFIGLTTGNIFNADNTTILGTSEINYTNFDIIIPNEVGKTQRLLDVAVTAPTRPLILYAPFTVTSQNDGVYKIYDAGTITVVQNAGEALWYNKYQNGGAWIENNKLVICRGYMGTDYVEIYSYSNNSVSLVEQVWSEPKGSVPIRNARPIVDIRNKSFLWHRGYYNPNNYTQFNCDAMIKNL